jgi:hypothetical protein
VISANEHMLIYIYLLGNAMNSQKSRDLDEPNDEPISSANSGLQATPTLSDTLQAVSITRT